MFARVPASSANLGPGFDTLGLALELYVEVALEPADEFVLTTSGEGAGLFDDERHLGALVATEVLGHRRFSLHVHSEIPVARGLGSSAALALAAAAAAGAADPLATAARVDGHAENAAASRYGGLVVARLGEGGDVVARALTLDPAWRFVVVIPGVELTTRAARAVLPREVPFADAVANLNALGLLIAGLGDVDAYVPGAMADRLHQPYRATLLDFADDLLEAMRDAGAHDACWSGAGSTMLGLTTEAHAPVVEAAARDLLARRGVEGEVLTLDADHVGLVTR